MSTGFPIEPFFRVAFKKSQRKKHLRKKIFALEKTFALPVRRRYDKSNYPRRGARQAKRRGGKPVGIVIVEYGVGNLRSVQKACAHLGAQAEITGDPAEIGAASRVILPGVGAFPEGMYRLRAAGLDAALRDVADRGTPLLGICLGMQLLFARGKEGVPCEGLGLIDGDITLLRAPGLKVPQIGWNDLQISPLERDGRPSPLFAGLPERPYVYFVHSYCAGEVSPAYTAATAVYGQPFTAAVQRGNVLGTQFHPEKSGWVGLRILKNFLEIGGDAPC
jgi:glutamine amidotransferase